MAIKQNTTTVYFDGSCYLCSLEIDSYRKRNTSHRLNFVDIAHQSFDPKSLNLDPKRVQQHLHVQTKDGKLVTGIDAFAEIWRQLDMLNCLVFLVENQPSRFLLKLGYSTFAIIRPMLPKKKCTSSECRRK